MAASCRRLRTLAIAALCVVAVATPRARAAETIVVGSVGSASANLWPVMVGDKKGLFAAVGINISMEYVQSNAGVIQQLTVDAVDVSVGSGLVDPIRAVDKGAPVAIVRIEMQRPPYALMAKSPIKRIADLKGKIVSVGGPKDITRIFFERMLTPSGVAAKDVDLIFAGATSARLQALQTGAADAAILTAPYNFHAEAAGFTNLGLAADVVDMPFSGVSTNRNWAKSHKDALQKFLGVYTQSIAWLSAPANREEAVKLMMSVSKLGHDDVEKAYDFLIKSGFLEPTGAISKGKLDAVVEALKQLGDIPPDFKVDRLFIPDVTRIVD
ncbi:MAG TPA: ABC transporter substrate-binding protein [Xanthobacteraceae bacterium]|nr:ABC transporter substrate-binding protein [Xanthobacteraceae bacterium]